ncbi:MAG: hypothetical protein M1396_00615 [Chloroflexi bacterium]|nr:hypothetical protein [Chloroflexota bacterium]
MEMSLEQQLRKRLGKYLDGVTTLDEFRSWFVPHVLLTIEQSTVTDDVRELVYTIAGLFAEFDHGDWTLAQLLAQLTPLRYSGIISAAYDEAFLKQTADVPYRAVSVSKYVQPAMFFHQGYAPFYSDATLLIDGRKVEIPA